MAVEGIGSGRPSVRINGVELAPTWPTGNSNCNPRVGYVLPFILASSSRCNRR
jgi:hypothetical protein